MAPKKKAAKATKVKKVTTKTEPAKAVEKQVDALSALLGKLSQAIKDTAHYQYEDKIKFPIEVNEVKVQGRMGVSTHRDHDLVGSYVAVRPVDDKFSGKTFLGIYIGDIPLGVVRAFDPHKKTLILSVNSNPAIFVPEMNRVIMGAESWWGPIKDENHLRQITNEDIQNIWYVKALKQLSEKAPEKAS